MPNPQPVPVNIIDALNGALIMFAKQVAKEQKDGKTYITYKVDYQNLLSGYIIYANNDLVYANGTAQGLAFAANINAPYQTKTFTRADLVLFYPLF